ncbi:vomeronasal type-2 receptor 26-like [Pseudophryne corroboree]|uniref:vomeronasal type-2 receptor 26-like n=1 Tax=Pseudophryne corroboree TaxID=495146 RepID=UPI0030821C00
MLQSMRKFKEENKFNKYLQPLDIIFNIMIWLCVLSVTVCRTQTQNLENGCHLSPVIKYGFEYKYSQEGDIIIGGIFTVNSFVAAQRYVFGIQMLFCLSANRREYRHLRAFIFTINEINRNPDILPNITLGYHVYDSCGSKNKAVEDVLRILSGHKKTVTNYRCMEHGKVAGFIGDLNSHTTIAMAQLLNVYGYTQISYGARDPALGDRTIYPHFFRTIHNDQMQFLATAKLIKLFGWNWVGIISSAESGEWELQQLSRQLASYGICIEFKITFLDENTFSFNKNIIENTTAEIIILCGTNTRHFMYFIRRLAQFTGNKTFIFPALWSNIPEIAVPYKTRIPVNCTLVFSLPMCNIPGAQDFLDDVNPPDLSSDPLMEDIWITKFQCRSKNEIKNFVIPLIIKITFLNCTLEKSLQGYLNFTRDPLAYRVHISVFTMAQTLHDMYLNLNNNGIRNSFEINQYKIHRYMRKGHYKDEYGKEIFYNGKGEFSSPLHILNWIYIDVGEVTAQNSKYVGTFDGSVPDNKQLYIEPWKISWRNGRMPHGQCSKKCLDGFRKAPKEGFHACCYNCVPCSEGEISNKPDNEHCMKCSNLEWPNDSRNQCIAKAQEFLSYEVDTTASVFSITAVLFSVIIVFIIGLFIFFRTSQIVRANNRNLSFILLISLKLSLLCVFLFLGRPVDITCMLRQICFGIIFTIAVSSVLAKTIMVCIAFKATRPGSYWRKWMGVKLPNSLVVICSSVQVLNGVIWLSVSPPFQEFNIDTYPETIIIQCNEGSVLAFYFMLGYMGLLAAVSFVLAFMVRTLPDIYNEAKYITFSMLVFCSVWVCAIPAYLSSKGKHMVIVEVFAILASCIGIVGCMFFSKCYNILMRPEVTRKVLMVGHALGNLILCPQKVTTPQTGSDLWDSDGECLHPEFGKFIYGFTYNINENKIEFLDLILDSSIRDNSDIYIYKETPLPDTTTQRFLSKRSSVTYREYRHVRAFIYAINQINRNPDILPNITLGYHLYDSCGNENKAVEDVFWILSGHKRLTPNYRCMKQGKVAGFIGDLNSHTTIPVAQMLNVYGYTQPIECVGKILLFFLSREAPAAAPEECYKLD